MEQMTEAKLEWDERNPTGLRPETVLKQCLRRIKYLNEVLPCFENKRIMRHLEMALIWEERRNKRRKDQGVQNTLEKHRS